MSSGLPQACFRERPLLEVDEVGLKEKTWRWFGNGHVSWVKNRTFVKIFPLGLGYPASIYGLIQIFPIRLSGINLWVGTLERLKPCNVGYEPRIIIAIKLVTFSNNTKWRSAVECPIWGKLTNGWVGDAPMYFLIGQSTVESNFVAAIDSLLKQMLAGWWFGTFGLFSISYMGCHPSHWLIFFRGVGWNHQPVGLSEGMLPWQEASVSLTWSVDEDISCMCPLVQSMDWFKGKFTGKPHI